MNHLNQNKVCYFNKLKNVDYSLYKPTPNIPITLEKNINNFESSLSILTKLTRPTNTCLTLERNTTSHTINQAGETFDSYLNTYFNNQINNIINNDKNSAFLRVERNNNKNNNHGNYLPQYGFPLPCEFKFQRNDLINMVKPFVYSDLLYNSIKFQTQKLAIQTVCNFSIIVYPLKKTNNICNKNNNCLNKNGKY